MTSQLSATLQFQRATVGVPVYPDEDGYCSWVRIMLLALLQVAQVLNNSQGRQPDDVRTPLSQSIIPLPHTDGVAVGGDAS